MKTLRGASALGTLGIIVFLMIVLYFVWVYTNGPESPLPHQGPLMGPLPLPTLEGTPIVTDGLGSSTAPTLTSGLSPWESTSNNSLWDYFYNFRTPTLTAADRSPYESSVVMQRGNVTTADASKEYVVISTSRTLKNNLTVTGWSIQSLASGITAPLGQAAHIPFLGDVNVEQPIVLSPGQKIYVTTGRSPNGVSFRTSKCTGYFEQFQNYTPSLKQQCPKPEDEMRAHPEKVAGNDLCIEYIENIGTCEYRSTSLPGNIGSTCQDFILNTLNYNGCINQHRNDPDFYGTEWRIFLKRDQELYKNTHDRIRLLDENKKVVAELSY